MNREIRNSIFGLSEGGSHAGIPWSSYWKPRYISDLDVASISETEQTITGTLHGTGYDGVSWEYSIDSGLNWNVAGTSILASYSAIGLSPNSRYDWRARLYKIVNGTTIYSEYCNSNWDKTFCAWYMSNDAAVGHRVAAYWPVKAANISESYSNLINPLTNDATPVVAPTWDAVKGWKFDGTQYMTTGIVPVNNRQWSIIIQYTEYGGGALNMLAGLYEDATKQFGLMINSATPSNALVGKNGGSNSYGSVQTNGILAVIDGNLYFNRNLLGGITSGSGTITYDIWIGCNHYTSAVQFFTGNIQKLAVYNYALPTEEITFIHNAMTGTNAEFIARNNYVKNRFGALICFSMPSFFDHTHELAPANQPPDTFAPTGMDVGSWLDACVSAGMKYVALTVKHQDGFCLWPSIYSAGAYTPYSIAQTTWYVNNGNPDIVDQFVTGCRSRGLKVGLYFSIYDLTWEARTGKTQITDTAGYIALVEGHLHELLTNYGTIDFIWTDSWGWALTYAYIPYATVYNYIKSIQPNCLLVENYHSYPCYTSQIDVYETTITGAIPEGNVRWAEEVQSIRNDGYWFYHFDLDQTSATLFTKTQELTKLSQVNARTGTFLLGITPTTAGVLPASQKALLESLPT